MPGAASGGALYGLGMPGAWMWFWQQADGFWEYVLAERCADGGHFVLFGSNYQDVFAFAVLILVLVFRPSGLLGERVADRA